MADEWEALLLCKRTEEYCFKCGTRMVMTTAQSGFDRDTGLPVIAVYHLCPHTKHIYHFWDAEFHDKHRAL